MGRQVSCVCFCSLWAIYILMSILQVGGKLGEVSIGTIDESKYDVSVQYWLTMCDKKYEYKDAKVSKYLDVGGKYIWGSGSGAPTTGSSAN